MDSSFEEVPSVAPFDYWAIVQLLYQKRKSIIGTIVFFTIITIGISLLLSNTYRATAIVLPDNDGGK